MIARIGTILVFAAVAFGLIGVPGAATAQTLPPPMVAVIDTQSLLRNSTAGKDVVAQMQKIRAGYQAEISRKETALRAEEQELLRQRTILAPEAFAEKGREFQGKVKDLRQYVGNAEQLVGQAEAKALDQIDRTIIAILNDLSPEYGFNIVLDASQTRMFLKSLTLTDKVLELLDQRLPTVTVAMPGQQ
jgi:Skp family chaperone for outer membrane proteins